MATERLHDATDASFRPTQLRPPPELARLCADERPFVKRVARRCGLSAADQEDIVQEVFVLLFAKRDSLDLAGSLRPWLQGVTTRCCANWRRSLGRERRRRDESLSELDELCGPGAPADELVANAQTGRDLARSMESLRPAERTVLQMTAFEQQTAREVAARLGVSPHTVASRLRLARKRLCAKKR